VIIKIYGISKYIYGCKILKQTFLFVEAVADCSSKIEKYSVDFNNLA